MTCLINVLIFRGVIYDLTFQSFRVATRIRLTSPELLLLPKRVNEEAETCIDVQRLHPFPQPSSASSDALRPTYSDYEMATQFDAFLSSVSPYMSPLTSAFNAFKAFTAWC
jgi:hypothetical protein